MEVSLRVTSLFLYSSSHVLDVVFTQAVQHHHQEKPNQEADPPQVLLRALQPESMRAAPSLRSSFRPQTLVLARNKRRTPGPSPAQRLCAGAARPQRFLPVCAPHSPARVFMFQHMHIFQVGLRWISKLLTIIC